MVRDRARQRHLLLSGERVGLAVMVSDDISLIARWNQDLDFTARIGMPGDAHTLEEREEAFAKNSRIRADSAEFALIELATDELVGFGGLFDIGRNGVGTLFVGIGDRELRGRGFGSEATRLICEYGFYFRSLFSIRAEVHAYNLPALQTYERVGFKEVGRWRGLNVLDGKRYDEVLLDLVRDEFSCRHVPKLDTTHGSATRPPIGDRQ